uniref:Uncharacterized protein n=1 Tax=Arundo donax TaxID=35708 RepID=A0A0A9CLZ3_ARUDO
MFSLFPLSSRPHRPDELPPLIHHPFHNNLCRPIIHARHQYNASKFHLHVCVRVFKFFLLVSSVASSSVTVCDRAYS